MGKSRDVRVGDFMELVRRQVVVDPTRKYVEIGIRSYGRGIFHKEPVDGSSIRSKRVFEIHPGQLVFNTVFAWEGAVAVTSEQEVGTIGSHRFMTYQVDPTIADVRYLCYLFQSEPGLGVIRAASPGSAGRNRTLGIRAFAEQYVPLPDLDEQRRIAAKLDRLLAVASRVGDARTRSTELASNVTSAAVHNTLGSLTAPKWYLGSDIPIVSGGTPDTSREDYWNGDVTWIGPADLGVLKGRTVERSRKSITNAGYRSCSAHLLPLNSVVLSSRAPVGRLAITQSKLCTNQGCKSFPPVDGLLPEYLYWALWGAMEEIHEVSRGTTFMEISKRRLHNIGITVPSLEQQHQVASYLNQIDDMTRGLGSWVRRAKELAEAVRPSALNAAFSGRL